MLAMMKKRADFVAANRRAKRVRKPGFVLQVMSRGDGAAPRVGYTCSKKVGNAVARNQAKRRLREVARRVLPTEAREGTDYILIGRPISTASHPFEMMKKDLEDALTKAHE